MPISLKIVDKFSQSFSFKGYKSDLFDENTLFGINLKNSRNKHRDNTKMDANKLISKEGLKWKCKVHPDVPCELICLDADEK